MSNNFELCLTHFSRVGG